MPTLTLDTGVMLSMVKLNLLPISAAFLLLHSCIAVGEEPNTLQKSESQAGWKLLFDGKTTEGWRNYNQDDISSGWQVIDGTLTRADEGAGDIVTKEQYDRFELSLEFKISPGGNSGLMYHVVEAEGQQPWFSGPEIQILDNERNNESQKCGWLYQLYSSPVDATKPAGEWNHLQIRITPEMCNTVLNGVRYARYVKGSRDWDERVADSKFAKHDQFGEASTGHICLQDHGDHVAFRNIKIRELTGDLDDIDPVDGELAIGPEVAFPKLQWSGWSPISEDGRAEALRPIVLTHAGDGSNRIFVATQRGVIHVFPNDQQATKTRVFLDLSDEVQYSDRQNEEGFLGLAFHPNYRDTGEFFAYYTPQKSDERVSVVKRFRVSKDDPNKADPEFSEEILRIEQPYWNHNGGTIAFGPDGHLYIGLGDGGAANDPHENGQDLSTWLGSILRIDIDHRDEGLNYSVPADNPFVDKPNARGEIWAYGLRNVWQLGFDRETGHLWVGDVGQDLWEEINIIRRGGNYGWNKREGMHPFGPDGSEADPQFVEPVWEYDHEIGRSITGGYVYRGKRLPDLEGAYLYADYVTGRLWALRADPESGKVQSNMALQNRAQPVISFGQDEQGEVYFLIVANDGRGIFRFAEQE